MPRRKLVAEIAFDSDVSTSHTVWTDVSADVSSIEVTAGRNSELDAIETGECVLVLDNTDGMYTPGRSTGFGPKIRVRRPVRAYISIDDNLVHFDCVNPIKTTVANDNRFYQGNGTFTGIYDGSLYYWEHQPNTGGASYGVYVGGNSDSDEIRISSGATVTVTADCYVTASGATAGVGVAFFPNTGGVTFSSFTSTGNLTSTTISYTYTAPADGTVRMMLWTTLPSGNTGKGRYRNLKMSFPSTDSGYSAVVTTTASGMYPEYRGYVDTWTVDTDGLTSTATVKAIDWLGVASRSISTYYREKYLDYLGGYSFGSGESAWYWDCVEAAEDKQSAAAFVYNGGSYPLNIIESSVPPQTGGFTTDTTMDYFDGSSKSGGFTVTDTNMAKGAVLSFVDKSYPSLPKLTWSNYWGTSFWLKGTWPTAGRSCLWQYAAANGVTQAAVYWNTSGTLTLEVLSDSGTMSSVTTTGVVPQNTAIFFRITNWYSNDVSATAYLDCYVRAFDRTVTGLPPATGVNAIQSAGPQIPAYIQWGGRIQRSTSQDFLHGTINHVTFGIGSQSTLYTLADDAFSCADTTASYTESSVVNDILNFANFPLYRRLDQGLSNVWFPSWEDKTDVNSLITATAADGNGLFFMGPDGSATFHSRNRRTDVFSKWNISEWGDRLSFVLDTQYTLNSVTASRDTGISRTMSDSTSIAQLGLRDREVRRNVQDPNELTQAAGWILHKYQGTAARCDTVTVDASALMDGVSDAALIGVAHGGAISDRLTFSGLPASAPADSLSFFIEGIRKSIQVDGSRLDYKAVFSVSSAQDSSAFILEDPVYGILDSDAAVLIY